MRHRLNILLYTISIALLSYFLRESEYFYLLFALLTLIFLTIMGLGVLFMQFNYFLRSITKLNNPYCLLTFDDGPDPSNTPKVLDVLKKHKVKAIFFVIGKKAEQHPELIKRIIQEGHIVGNHSYDHNNFMSMHSKARLRKDIGNAQDVLQKIGGRKIQIFRPPIGYTNPNYASVLKEMNLKCVGWTLRSYDSVYKDEQKLKDRLISNIKPGQIILLHDNLSVTAESLEDFISTAQSNGILFASDANIKTIFNA